MSEAANLPERLQKILARAGVASRRKVEEMILEGRVTLNGRVATLGDKASVAQDSIKVDGKRVGLPATHHYLLLNKPKGVMTTVEDPEGRPTVMELVPAKFRKALVPVGRLDFMTEGLLLLTNDGEFAQRLSHPRYGCRKTYLAKVSGAPREADLDKLRAGVVLEGRRTAPCRIEAAHAPSGKREGENTWWNVDLSEGRTRQIREMFERIGHPVQKLRRVAIGPLRDAALPVGALRELSAEEVERLLRATATVKPRRAVPPVVAHRGRGGAAPPPVKAGPRAAARTARSFDDREKRTPGGKRGGGFPSGPQPRPDRRPPGRPERGPERGSAGERERGAAARPARFAPRPPAGPRERGPERAPDRSRFGLKAAETRGVEAPGRRPFRRREGEERSRRPSLSPAGGAAAAGGRRGPARTGEPGGRSAFTRGPGGEVRRDRSGPPRDSKGPARPAGPRGPRDRPPRRGPAGGPRNRGGGKPR